MKKPKKIAIYCNTWDANGGGGIVYVLAIAKILAENGFDTCVFFKDTVALSELHNRYKTKGLKIKIQKRNTIPLLSQINFAVKEWLHFDIVIQQSIVAPRLTFVKKSFILCDFPMEKIGTISKKIRFTFWKNILVNSEYTKNWVRNYWKREAIVFYPPVEKSGQLNLQKNLDIVSIGRFNNGKRSKRQDVVIEVFKELVTRGYKDINLQLIGYVQDTDYLNKLKAIAIGFPIYFNENCSSQQSLAILNKSAIFISACGFENDENESPMLVEHYGISVVEAMTEGCIPVVLGKGGHKETVDHNINGYHWNTKEELKGALISLLNNKQLREKMSKSAYLKSEEYSFIKFEEKILKTLNN